MIDITPLDVRNKSGDFRKVLRGYDPQDVDAFLGLVAERMEELVKDTLTLRERADRLQEQVASQEGREKAVQNALVTAQELRDDIRTQAQAEAREIRERAEREAELLRREAEAEAEGIVGDARRLLEERRGALEELERKRLRFLKTFRALLEREMDMVEVEEGRTPLDDVAVELELGGGASWTASGPEVPEEAAGVEEETPANVPTGDEPGDRPWMADAPELELPTGAPVEEEAREPVGDDLEPPPGDAMVHDLAAGEGSGEESPPSSGGRDEVPAPDDPKEWLASFLDEESEVLEDPPVAEDGATGEGGEEEAEDGHDDREGGSWA
jgi:DivIVA domain-containing protein